MQAYVYIIVQASAIDVLPTSPEALLSSCFIAGTAITTNIAGTRTDLMVLFGPTPNHPSDL